MTRRDDDFLARTEPFAEQRGERLADASAGYAEGLRQSRAELRASRHDERRAGDAQGRCRGRGSHGRSRRGGSGVHDSCVRGSVHRLVQGGRRPPPGDSRAATARYHHTSALAQRRHGSDRAQQLDRDVPAQHHRSDRTFAPAVFQSRRGPARQGRRASPCAAAIDIERFGAIVLGFVAPSERRACPGHADDIGTGHEPSGARASRTKQVGRSRVSRVKHDRRRHRLPALEWVAHPERPQPRQARPVNARPGQESAVVEARSGDRSRPTRAGAPSKSG